MDNISCTACFFNNDQMEYMIDQIDGFKNNMTMILNSPKQD